MGRGSLTAKQKALLWDQCDRACEHLPQGWSISIQLEKDAGWVELWSPDGRVELDSGTADLARQVEFAIEMALNPGGDYD